MKRLTVGFSIVLFALPACTGGTQTDATADGDATRDIAIDSVLDVPASETSADVRADVSACTDDLSCTDHVFCNGVERCMPGAAGADARGCAPATAPACSASQSCDEANARCNTMCADADGDGHHAASCGGDDCDDNDAQRFPGNTEVCDGTGHDEDCDPCTVGGSEGDSDHDTFVSMGCFDSYSGPTPTCDPTHLHVNGSMMRVEGLDCDDSNPDVRPNQVEACNGHDDNCNGMIDEDVMDRPYYADCDGDMYGAIGGPSMIGCAPPATGPSTCPTGRWSADNTDCDDANVARNPGAGFFDCGGRCGSNTDPTACGMSCTACTAPTNGSATCATGACGFACDAGYRPMGTGCVSTDADGDGHRATAYGGDDCDDSDPNRYPGNAEVCDLAGHDEDCDPSTMGNCAAPRPIAPLSTSRVTSQRPTLHWVLGPSTDGASIDICRDRACTMIAQTFTATGTSGTVPTALARGSYFWRLRGRAGTATGMSTSPTWEFFVRARTATNDTSWGSVPDIDGDGLADTVVSAPYAPSGTGAGRVYTYLSTPSLGPGSVSRITAPPGSVTSLFGHSVAMAGDVDGDGYGDLAVGTNYTTASPSVLVYRGGPGMSFSTPMILTAPGVTYFGQFIASAGDVNGDGYADLLVVGNTTAMVFDGGPSGLATAPSWTHTNNGDGGVEASDVNGDGYSDIVLPFPTHSVSIYFGSSSGLPSTASVSIPEPSGLNRFGAVTDTISGVAASSDLNGDGLADIAVLGQTLSPGIQYVYVYAGSRTSIATTPSTTLTYFGTTLASGGDFDNDGFDDLLAVDLSIPRWCGFRGQAAGVSSTCRTINSNAPIPSPLALAGDLNGDGFDDVLIGNPAFDPSTDMSMGATGQVQIAFGGTSAFGTGTSIASPSGAYTYFGSSLTGRR